MVGFLMASTRLSTGGRIVPQDVVVLTVGIADHRQGREGQAATAGTGKCSADKEKAPGARRIRGAFSGELQVTSRSRHSRSHHSRNRGNHNRHSPKRGILIRIRRPGLRQGANPNRRPILDASPSRPSPHAANPIRLHTSGPA